ncbi:peptidylprolyl isomerase [Thalassotalea profundi]|nr:peptidylprolyl isomerase [Thalassotalea profundi]
MTHLFTKKFAILAVVLSMLSSITHATIVEFQTSHGSFKVNLHDTTTPLTVENFLNYISSERYNNTVIHRVVDDFVVQGGGYTFNNELPLKDIDIYDPVKNEPIYSNVRGTIAMAKQANSVNSATSQWFFNLSNNSTNLDLQNGGFTVFGEVIDDGMQVLDEIAALQRCGDVPVNDNSTNSCNNPGADNFVTVYQVLVLDDADNTDSSLNSIKNTLITQTPDTESNDDNSSGGSVFWLLLCLMPLAFRKHIHS